MIHSYNSANTSFLFQLWFQNCRAKLRKMPRSTGGKLKVLQMKDVTHQRTALVPTPPQTVPSYKIETMSLTRKSVIKSRMQQKMALKCRDYNASKKDIACRSQSAEKGYQEMAFQVLPADHPFCNLARQEHKTKHFEVNNIVQMKDACSATYSMARKINQATSYTSQPRVFVSKQLIPVAHSSHQRSPLLAPRQTRSETDKQGAPLDLSMPKKQNIHMPRNMNSTSSMSQLSAFTPIKKLSSATPKSSQPPQITPVRHPLFSPFIFPHHPSIIVYPHLFG